jgi:two-component system, OmpR family, response regulator
MAKILLVEDDSKYAGVVEDYLSSHHHTVQTTATVDDALAFLAVYQYELLIVDWQLPDAEGPDLIKSLRSKSVSTPILMLTAREGIADKEHGFDSGADDYLTKNASPRELVARIQALLRRAPVYRTETLRVADIEIDSASRCVKKAGNIVHLQPKEFAVLEYLARNPKRVFSADELLERLWDPDTEADSHTVRSTVNKIRKKLDNPDSNSVISTKYKAGYQINV